MSTVDLSPSDQLIACPALLEQSNSGVIFIRAPANGAEHSIWDMKITCKDHSWVLYLNEAVVSISYTLNKLLANFFKQSKISFVYFFLRPRGPGGQVFHKMVFEDECSDFPTVALSWQLSDPAEFRRIRFTHPSLWEFEIRQLCDVQYIWSSMRMFMIFNFLIVDCPRWASRLFKSDSFKFWFSTSNRSHHLGEELLGEELFYSVADRIKLISTKQATVYALPLIRADMPPNMNRQFVKKWVRMLISQSSLDRLELPWSPILSFDYPIVQLHLGESYSWIKTDSNPIRFYFWTTDSRWSY